MNPTHNPIHTNSTDTAPPPWITPADLLRGAALYLERHGWHQGDMFADLDQPFPAACATGAIRMAACGTTNPSHTGSRAAEVTAAIKLLAFYLEDNVYEPVDHRDLEDHWAYFNYVGDWNDEKGQTAAAVIDVLRAAADHYDRLHNGTGGAR
jgi:hypothetical protein